MRYRRPGASTRMVIVAGKTATINGRNEYQRGIYADFVGHPPTFESEKEAKDYVDWEKRARKIDPTDPKIWKRRFNEINKLIMEHIETHPKFIDEFDPKRKTFVMKDIPPVEEARLSGMPVCVYCEHVFENSLQLHDHEVKTHKEEILKRLEQESNDETGIAGGDTEAVGQA